MKLDPYLDTHVAVPRSVCVDPEACVWCEPGVCESPGHETACGAKPTSRDLPRPEFDAMVALGEPRMCEACRVPVQPQPAQGSLW